MLFDVFFQTKSSVLFQLKGFSTETLIFGLCWGKTSDILFDVSFLKVMLFSTYSFRNQRIFQKYEYSFEDMYNFSKICVTFKLQHIVYRKLTKLSNTTRNPRTYVRFGAKVGKPTCVFFQLWFLQYCIQAVDMISACTII